MTRSSSLRALPRVPPRKKPSDRIPIEELARRTGVTVRNLRAMHARSLLLPPELVGRKGFYTERHEARVRLVLKLQSRGFSLAAIHALIAGWEKGSGILEVMGLEDALMTPGVADGPVEVEAKDAFPELVQSPRALAKALEQGLVVERDGRIVAPDAELLDIVKQEVKAGFPLETALNDGDTLLADVERIATRFRKSFFDHVVNPHLAAGDDGRALPDVAAKVALLRPLAVRLVTILFARALERGGGPEQARGGATKKNARAPKKKRTTTKHKGRRI